MSRRSRTGRLCVSMKKENETRKNITLFRDIHTIAGIVLAIVVENSSNAGSLKKGGLYSISGGQHLTRIGSRKNETKRDANKARPPACNLSFGSISASDLQNELGQYTHRCRSYRATMRQMLRLAPAILSVLAVDRYQTQGY